MGNGGRQQKEAPNDGQAFLQLREEGRSLGQEEESELGDRHLHDDALVAARANAALGSLPSETVSKDPEAKNRQVSYSYMK